MGQRYNFYATYKFLSPLYLSGEPSSWNTYFARISDGLIRRQTDALVSTGLSRVGYRYVNIDDGFFAGRDAKGNLLINTSKFPGGLKPVVEYIHGKGLKAGIYTDAGHNTCASFYNGEPGGVGAGIYEHEAQDCRLYFDSLKFDFIKVDFCGGNAPQNSEHLALDPQTRYTDIAKAIKATGRDVVYNVCRWDFPGTGVQDGQLLAHLTGHQQLMGIGGQYHPAEYVSLGLLQSRTL